MLDPKKVVFTSIGLKIIFVNACVRYNGTKCKRQKVTLSALKFWLKLEHMLISIECTSRNETTEI